MRARISAVAVWVLAAWLAACAAAPPLPPADPGPRVRDVHVLSNGWHTAVVLPRAAVEATGLLPEAGDFPDAVFLEFSWGDRTYFPAREATLGMALEAALTPTPAVMHVVGLAQPPERAYPQAERAALRLTEANFLHLIRTISGQFDRADGGRAPVVAPGLYPKSRFYAARGTFHLFNTCNTWTARMLRAGGVDIVPAGIITADELMARLRAALDGPSRK